MVNQCASVQAEEVLWHAMEKDEALGLLRTSLQGLGVEEAKHRLERHGPNELERAKGVSAWRILLGQFKNVLIVILIAATILSAVIGEWVDAAVIIVIVLLCAVLGFFQEYRAERAIEALKKMLSPSTLVLRDGKETTIPLREVVPGDVLVLQAGDRVPADARLTETTSLQVDEAPLTGESIPVNKEPGVLPRDVPTQDRRNMVFTGTTVTYGKGKAVVTATGMKTEFGKIAGEVAVVTKGETPLEKRIRDVGKWLGIICLATVFLVATFSTVSAYMNGVLTWDFALGMVLFSVALAVAAVPEALPAVVTGALAIGMHEMARRNALVRKMPAVETLGCTTVICSDKTGTLTRGEMTVRRIYCDEKTFHVTGVGYEPKGEFHLAGSKVDPAAVDALPLLMKAAVLCNDADLVEDGGTWQIRGDPTEAALLVAAKKAGLQHVEVRRQNPRIGEAPFSSERKRMTTIHRTPEGRRVACTKGAPEVVLNHCTHVFDAGKVERLTAGSKEGILGVNEDMAGSALRVLGIACRELPEALTTFTEESVERGLTFVGLVGMIDPPRGEAVEAVRVCNAVGMKPVMITGDHKLTAVAIAREMGIHNDGDVVLTGAELDALNDETFEKTVDKVTVYARVSPLHKLRIVKMWKQRGEVVAMTGDGVNDAPALKHADIGIAMGITGTEVTKEASDMVLADDNFATIVKAVERGRWIFDNIKKYLTYLLRCNIIEMVVIGGGVLAGLPLPLIPAQILFINLVTDGPPALALGISPPDPDLMRRPPRRPEESVFAREVKVFILGTALLVSPLLFWSFLRAFPKGLSEARTGLFLQFLSFELTTAISCRSLTNTVLEAKPHKALWLSILIGGIATLAVFGIPTLAGVFELTTPGLIDIAEVIALCALVFVGLESLKVITRRRPRVLQ